MPESRLQRLPELQTCDREQRLSALHAASSLPMAPRQSESRRRPARQRLRSRRGGRRAVAAPRRAPSCRRSSLLFFFLVSWLAPLFLSCTVRGGSRPRPPQHAPRLRLNVWFVMRPPSERPDGPAAHELASMPVIWHLDRITDSTRHNPRLSTLVSKRLSGRCMPQRLCSHL